MATLPQTAPSRVPAAACGGSRAGKCSGSLDAAEGLPRGASPWTGAMHRAAKPAGMMLDDQLAGDHAFDPQGSSLEFTEKGSILWKGFKIGDKGVMAAPDGAPPSSGVLALPPLPCRPCPAARRLHCSPVCAPLGRHHDGGHQLPGGDWPGREQHGLPGAGTVVAHHRREAEPSRSQGWQPSEPRAHGRLRGCSNSPQPPADACKNICYTR